MEPLEQKLALAARVVTQATSVAVPAAGSYNAGDELIFRVKFSAPVTVSGSPRVDLEVGRTTVPAAYVGGSGTATLVFSHTVLRGENDADGIALARSITLPAGAAIVDGSRRPVSPAIPSARVMRVRVDTNPPVIASVAGPAGKTYAAKGVLAFTVNFAENVKVTGVPRLPIDVGGIFRNAVWNGRRNGTSSLTFTATVPRGVRDTDGVRVIGSIDLPANATIRDVAGNDAGLAVPTTSRTFSAAKVDAIGPRVTACALQTVRSTLVSLQMTFDKPVIVTGRPSIPFTLGTLTRQLVYGGGSGRNVLTFSYVPLKSESPTAANVVVPPQAITLSRSATIADALGNPVVSLVVPKNLSLSGATATSPYVVDNYLTTHPSVAAAVQWEQSYSQWVPWSQWTDDQKADLRLAFNWEWQWYQGGMTVYNGWALPDPIVNQEPPGPNAPWIRTVVDPTTAWHLYVTSVAHAIAADVGGWVPCKLDDYSSGELNRLLDSNWLVRADSNNNTYSDTMHDGFYVVQANNMTPSSPTYVFKWLLTNQLIGASSVDTIARVLDWCRWNLSHIFGDFALANYMNYWPYAGATPVRMMIEGTVCADPVYQPFFPGVMHWTGGCAGTTRFIAEVLRSANIPVDSWISGGQHYVPHFLHDDLYLTHGDDPYSSASKATPPFSAGLLLVDAAQFKDWFGAGGEAAAKNVGRRPMELSIDYPTDAMLALYVDDVTKGRGHAEGRVYNEWFQNTSDYGNSYYYFTLAELEARGLWTNLDTGAKARGLL